MPKAIYKSEGEAACDEPVSSKFIQFTENLPVETEPQQSRPHAHSRCNNKVEFQLYSNGSSVRYNNTRV